MSLASDQPASSSAGAPSDAPATSGSTTPGPTAPTGLSETAWAELAFEHLPVAACVLEGPQHVYRRVNARYRELAGRHDLLGRPVHEAFPALEAQGFTALLDDVYARGVTRTGRGAPLRFAHAGTPATLAYDFTYTPLRDAAGVLVGVLVTVEDVTEQRRLDGDLQEQTRMLEIVADVNARLASGAGVNEMVQSVTDAGTELTGAQFGAFFYNVVRETGEALTLYTLSGAPVEAFSRFPMPRNTAVFHPTLSGEGIVRSDDITQDARYGQSAPYHGMPEGHLPVRSYLSVPVLSPGGAVLGGLFFGHEDPAVFTAADEEVISALAHQAAIALERERTERAARHELAERRRAEATLREREEQLRALVTQVAVGIASVDPAGRFIEVNAKFCEIVGRPAEALLGMHMQDLTHPDDLPGNLSLFERATAEGQAFFIEKRYLRPDGTTVWVRNHVSPIRDAAGRIVTITAISLDVTAERAAVQALRQSEEQARLALEASGTGVWRFDHGSGAFAFDERAQQAYDFGSEPVPLERFFGRVHPDDLPWLSATVSEALSPDGDGLYAVEYRVVHDDGTVHYLDVRARIEFEGEGEMRKAVRSFGTVADVTASRAAAAELRQARDQLEARVQERTAELGAANRALEQRNRELQDFAYVASHDLQEPLRKIRAFAGMLDTAPGVTLDEEGRHYVDRMQVAAERMSRLIRDLLAFSRVSTAETDAQPVDLAATLDRVLADLDVRLQESAGTVRTPEPLPTVLADPVQMHQLLLNLVGNALKFYRPGVPPVIEVGAAAADGGLTVSVADNGIGFDTKHAERIFSPFQRLHARDAYEGTGMGLAIVRRIVERHGGTIDVTSTVGQGSRFVIRLPQSERGA